MLQLSQGKTARVLAGHPWVFAGELLAPPEAAWDGEAATLVDARGRVLGSGICNSRSGIAWRRFTAEADRAFDETTLAAALDAALVRRTAAPCRRLVYSESDGLPGLIVDQYGDVLVVQALSMAIERRLPLVINLLRSRLSPGAIVVRPDAPVRRLEGLEVSPGYVAWGAVSAPVLEIDGMRFVFDPLGSQKTGFYLDQLPQYARVAAYAPGRRVLDAFCNQGAFALFAARGGAKQVTAIDSSRPALELARANAAANGLAVDWVAENVFDWFTQHRQEAWDLVVLDPPPFVRSRGMLERGLAGYKEINLRALASLAPGGILATFSCSHHVRPEIFRDLVAAAAADCGRSLRLLEECRQPADHPVLLEFPESAYLTGLIVEVGGRLAAGRRVPGGSHGDKPAPAPAGQEPRRQPRSPRHSRKT